VKVGTATLLDLQHALQATVLFIIMAIVDQEAGSLSWTPKFNQVFKVWTDSS
jgi:hypothetical protein